MRKDVFWALNPNWSLPFSLVLVVLHGFCTVRQGFWLLNEHLVNRELSWVENCKLQTLLLRHKLPCSNLSTMIMIMIMIMIVGMILIIMMMLMTMIMIMTMMVFKWSWLGLGKDATCRIGLSSCCSNNRSSGLASPPSWIHSCIHISRTMEKSYEKVWEKEKNGLQKNCQHWQKLKKRGTWVQ